MSEAYMRLAQQQPGKQGNDRPHFVAVAARVGRAVLVDDARARGTVKRGDGAVGVTLAEAHASVPARPVALLDLDAALLELVAMNAEKRRIVERRSFARLSIDETAKALAISPSTVKCGRLAAKTRTRRHLDGDLAAP